MECLKHRSHRPWEMLKASPGWRQHWLDLAFFHWPIEKEVIQRTLPEGLELDLYDGQAWLSVVPFRMEGVMKRGLPSIPGISNFPELNLRTYVTYQGKPGVWFYSLDADQSLAVWAARTFFHLPYFKATMKCESDGEGGINYRSERRIDSARFEASYRPVGEVYHAKPGTLEEWLCERYCLYAASNDGQLYRGEIHHKAWPLQEIEYDISINELASSAGFGLQGKPVSAQFARKIQVAVWGIQPCG